MKKFFSLVLALVMALSLTTVAWGASATVTTDAQLTAALSTATAGDVITFGADITIAATQDTHNITTMTGIFVPAGVIIDGNGYTLTVTGAGDETTNTTNSAIKSIDGITVKNLEIVGGARGIYIAGAVPIGSVTKNTVFEDLTIVNSCRAYNLSGGCAAGVTLTVSNCTLAGQCSSEPSLASTNFVNCTFVTNGSAKGDFVEPKGGDVNFDNCVFSAGYEVGFEDFTASSTMDFVNCVYDGEPLTADNMDDLFDSFYDPAVDGAAAAYTATGTTAVDTKDAKTMAVKGAMVIEMVPAKAAYVNAAGNWVPGYVKYYEDEYGTAYVPCTADTEDALFLYYKGTTSVYDIVVAANPVYFAAATEFTNFGTGCGQLDNRADKTAKYYTVVDGNGVKALYQGTTATAVQVLVGDKLVGIVNTDLINALNDHKWVVEKNAKNEITKATCSLCGQPATWVLNMASIPTGAEFEPAPGGGYLYWNPAPVATEKPSTDKVTSADTFDAGIAMYVGMSVMAATGAVVLKKRED